MQLCELSRSFILFSHYLTNSILHVIDSRNPGWCGARPMNTEERFWNPKPVILVTLHCWTLGDARLHAESTGRWSKCEWHGLQDDDDDDVYLWGRLHDLSKADEANCRQYV